MASPRKTSAAKASAPAAATDTVATGAFSLAAVIAATVAGNFLYTPVAFHAPLIESGDVEVNPDMKDEYGNIATRATTKHVQESNQVTDSTNTAVSQGPAVAAVAKPVFEVESNVAIPEKVKGASTGLRAGRTPIYPFDALEIGQSFFVPNKGDKSAAKAMASTVAGANARFTEEVEGQTRVNRKNNTVPVTKQLRKFKIFDTERTVTADDGTASVQKGARVFRVALDSAELQAAAS